MVRPRVLMVAAGPSLLASGTDGWLVVNAHDERSALVALDQGAPDVVVLDVALLEATRAVPSLLERLRTGNGRRPSRLMLVDLSAGARVLPRRLAAAAHDYIQAPVVSADLHARIQAQLVLGAALGGAQPDGVSA